MKTNTEQQTTRTNIVLDTKLVKTALEMTGLKTRRELVDFALRELVRHQQQKKLLELRGKIHWEGDLDDMRTSKNPGDWD